MTTNIYSSHDSGAVISFSLTKSVSLYDDYVLNSKLRHHNISETLNLYHSKLFILNFEVYEEFGILL